MKILIVEDQAEKVRDVISFLNNHLTKKPEYHTEESLHGGLKALLNDNSYDLIILDMSMPNFNPSPEDMMGGAPESFAGKELLSQMKLREINIPVLVLTQYATFAKGQVSLEELDENLMNSFQGFYLGAVYYSSADKNWTKSIEKLIKDL